MGNLKKECEELMKSVLPFADQMLRKYGEFFPYGAALKTSGEMVAVAPYDDREKPASLDIIRLLKQRFMQGANSGEYKATVLVHDIRTVMPSTGKKTDAVAVSLNHREHYSVIVLFPYTRKDGKLRFGEGFAQEGEADVFPPQ